MPEEYDYGVDLQEDAEYKEQFWKDEYEDRTGENTAAGGDDKQQELSDYECEHCHRRSRQRASFLFKPMCCSKPMKEIKRVEKPNSYEALVKKAKLKAAQEKKAAKAKGKKITAKPVKAAKKAGKAKPSKKIKPVKAKHASKAKPSKKPAKAKKKKR